MEKNKLEIFEQITALVDNELDSTRASQLKEKINTDSVLYEEYMVQSEIKHLLQNRFSAQTAPSYLYQNIKNSIIRQS